MAAAAAAAGAAAGAQTDIVLAGRLARPFQHRPPSSLQTC